MFEVKGHGESETGVAAKNLIQVLRPCQTGVPQLVTQKFSSTLNTFQTNPGIL